MNRVRERYRQVFSETFNEFPWVLDPPAGVCTIVVGLANRPLGVWWLYSWKMVLTVVAQQFGSTQILGFSETPHSTSCSTAKPAIFHFAKKV
ncbi:hypothetical protein BDL97_02G079500 [Sphagnum fallax]|nr:hypothetical protein BDL97_02G079500 [Sphagnum fallax]